MHATFHCSINIIILLLNPREAPGYRTINKSGGSVVLLFWTPNSSVHPKDL